MTKHNFYIPQGRIRSYSQYKNCYSYHLVKHTILMVLNNAPSYFVIYKSLKGFWKGEFCEMIYLILESIRIIPTT